jgi:hypothetical protein
MDDNPTPKPIDMPPLPPPIRTITRPYSRLTLLCGASRKCAGSLTTFKAVAEVIKVSNGRVTQLFGFAEEAQGLAVKTSETEDQIANVARAFTADGITCDDHWFYLDYEEFAAHFADPPGASAARSTKRPAANWELREGTVLADLVELRLHPPRPANESADSYYVDATLLFGTARVDYEPEDANEDIRTVAIALREARLAVGSDRYRPLHKTMLGEREGTRASPNYRHVAGGIDITGPAPNGTLEGDPIGDEHLAVIAGTNVGDNEFPISIAALNGSFIVATADARSNSGALEPASVNRNAILNAFIYSRTAARDDANRVVLARATMTLRPENDDPV